MSNPAPPPGSQGAPGPPASSPRLDLSKLRHDLRTPINHVLGYCELLQEDEHTPASFQADLQKIHTGGRQLLALITEYFDEEIFEAKRHDLHQLCHELRTPVNHIIGYSELLGEEAEALGRAKLLPDLKQITGAARTWLALMEEYLVTPAAEAVRAGANPADLLPPGLGFTPPAALGPGAAATVGGHLLVVDDDDANREMLARRLAHDGWTVSVARGGLEALQAARLRRFDLILLDMVMPGLDGYQVLTKLKSAPALAEVPVIMISALDQEQSIARCLELGAEDYVAKPFNPILLRARLGACLEKKRLRDRERAVHEALQRSEQHLAAELAKAADYVRSLLPAPLAGAVETEWCFQPSEQLGGDAFGYHWIDADHFAVYLLDVCGHGVGAALLSVSVLNTLRAQTLPEVDFRQPAAVLAALDHAFRMEQHNQLYFTAWYGVYRPGTRELTHASGGHPPALLLAGAADRASSPTPLSTAAPAIGCLDNAAYVSATRPVERGARLLVLSDGVFEIFGEGDRVGTWEEFVAGFGSPEVAALRPEGHWRRALARRGAKGLEDDFSLVEVRFG
jgi:sigma-B regulation protein RsbU (phosphoserine phosphatase)